MDKTLRSILWILVGLVVLSSFSTAWFFVAKERLYNDYINLENLFKTSMEKLNVELASINKEKGELGSKLEAAQEQLKILEAKNSEFKYQYEALLKEKDGLNRELLSVKKGKIFLEKRVKDMESDIFVTNLLKERASLEVEIDRLKNTLAPKDMELEKSKIENMDISVKLSKLEKEKNLTEQKLRDATQVAEILSRDLLKEKAQFNEDRQEFEKVKMENNVLRTKIADLGEVSGEYNKLVTERENAGLKISKLESDLEYKNREIDKLKTAFQSAISQAQETRAEAYHSKDEVNLPPIVVNREPPQEMAKLTTPTLERINQETGLEGRVLTVNREHNFVVIDLGRQDGIDIGNIFNVYRGDALLGTVEVIQARDRIAAADIKDTKEGFIIEINDTVIKR